jgi:hypothetical protein
MIEAERMNAEFLVTLSPTPATISAASVSAPHTIQGWTRLRFSSAPLVPVTPPRNESLMRLIIPFQSLRSILSLLKAGSCMRRPDLLSNF